MSSGHGLDPQGTYQGDLNLMLERIQIYYMDARHRYVPRSVLVELDPSPLDSMLAGTLGKLFFLDNFMFSMPSPLESIRAGTLGELLFSDNFMSSLRGTGNNWAKGRHTDGAELADSELAVVRRERVNHECPQALQLTHTLVSDTSLGLGTFLSTMRDEYPHSVLNTFSVVPRPKVYHNTDEPHNTLLSFHQLIENTGEVFCVDNEAMYNIRFNTVNMPTPAYANLNHLVSRTVSDVNTYLRFSSQMNLLKAVNMVPVPHHRFFMDGFGPLTVRSWQTCPSHTVSQRIHQMLNARNMKLACDSPPGPSLTTAVIFRGPV